MSLSVTSGSLAAPRTIVTLTAGTKLGPYEILAPLGAGGMGEVYRARDTRLGRDVAIKVLPAEVASDPSRLKRFEKEARAASALNHPNIVTIHDTGTTGDVTWIAMERVDGETLRKLLADGPLPIRKLLPLAAQIAGGLAKAHEAGIVHRDLKPENVMVTKEGFVKILDFGLAKLTGPVSDQDSQLPTVTGTSPGIVLGTASYMSPEQASGQAVDFRSDQFALGSILYEMATGKRAFARKTAVDTLSAILNEEPVSIAAVSPQTPAPVRWLVERCLAKDPDDRYASTRDLARELAGIQRHLSEAGISGATTAAGGGALRQRVALLPVLGAGLIALALTFVLGRETAKAPIRPTFRRLTFRHGFVDGAAFAPDGQTVVYSVNNYGKVSRLFSLRLGNPESAALDLPEARLESISRSGELAIALRSGTLARAPILGGAPREVLDKVDGASWAPDGRLAVARTVEGKSHLEFPIGRLLYETAGLIDSPRFSPKGDHIAFFEYPIRGDTHCSVAVVDLSGAKVTSSPSWANEAQVQGLSWSPDGEEVWFSSSRSGLDSDIRALRRSGKERMVLSLPLTVSLEDISNDGHVLLGRWTEENLTRGLGSGEQTERDLTWLDDSYAVDISADGRSLLIGDRGVSSGPNGAVGLRRMDGSPVVRLGEGLPLALSPDGKWALAYLPHPEPAQLVLFPTGPGQTRTFPHDSIDHTFGASWFPDGQRIAFLGSESGHGSRLYVQDLAGGSPRPISPEGASGEHILVSPDGKSVTAQGADGKWALFPVDGGNSLPIPGVTEGETPIQRGSDGATLFVLGKESAKIHRLSFSPPRREVWKELALPELAPATTLFITMTPDGKAYAYNTLSISSDLYLAEGLK